MAETDADRIATVRTHYAPYGEPLNRTVDGPGYTGHVHDASTGLVYAQQRYYDPIIGRFLSIDPVEADPNSGSNFNRYWYANNNPYKFTDPDGRNAITGAAIGCAVTGPACPGGAVIGAVVGTVIGVGAVLIFNEIVETSEDSQESSDGAAGQGGAKVPDPASGLEKDTADSSGQLTKAGRAQQKHGDRDGSAFDPAKGAPANKNAQGQETLDSITNSPDKTSEPNQRGGTDVRESPDGRGARFDKCGKFTGFIELRKPQP